jgi:predicted nucleic acid-binding Zn ribbon protein
MVRRRDPVPLAGALEALVRSVQPGSVLAEVQRQWPAAVGETIAGWARPVAEKAGVVVVECDDSVIAHELEMIKTELLGKLRERIETGTPRELKFRVG